MSGRRFEEAGFNGLAQVWSGWAQGNDAGVEEQGSGEWQGSTSWRRCRGAGFRGMAGLNRMMRGRVLAERTGAVRDGKRRGPRKAPGPFGGGKRRGPRKAPGPFGGVGSWWYAVMPGAIGHMCSVQA